MTENEKPAHKMIKREDIWILWQGSPGSRCYPGW